MAMSKTNSHDTSISQGQALDTACRALLRAGTLRWEWARSKAGQGAAWVVSIGDREGRIATVLVGADGDIEAIGI